MSKTVQLQILKEEEKVLRDLEAKLKNQLTRLKVEELTLLNHIRSAEDEHAPTPVTMVTDNLVEVELPDQSSLVEPCEENPKPVLDLDVNKQLLMLVGADDEEEEDEDDEDDITEHDQLTAFMKQLEKNVSAS